VAGVSGRGLLTGEGSRFRVKGKKTLEGLWRAYMGRSRRVVWTSRGLWWDFARTGRGGRASRMGGRESCRRWGAMVELGSDDSVLARVLSSGFALRCSAVHLGRLLVVVNAYCRQQVWHDS
jgi:hypothetical protein